MSGSDYGIFLLHSAHPRRRQSGSVCPSVDPASLLLLRRRRLRVLLLPLIVAAEGSGTLSKKGGGREILENWGQKKTRECEKEKRGGREDVKKCGIGIERRRLVSPRPSPFLARPNSGQGFFISTVSTPFPFRPIPIAEKPFLYVF